MNVGGSSSGVEPGRGVSGSGVRGRLRCPPAAGVLAPLSQAGPAIAASHLTDKAELMGHGAELRLDPETILRSAVFVTQRAENATVRSRTSRSRLVHPGWKIRRQLGASWAANPDLQQAPIPDGGRWPCALSYLIGTRGPPPTLPLVAGGIVYAGLESPGRTGADLDRVTAQYPTLVGARVLKHDRTGDTPCRAR